MRCPFCQAEKESLKVIDSRACDGGRSIRRRRECLHCAKRFTTYERIEDNVKLMVVKKDGRRVPWDKAKVMAGLERACFKRPVAEAELLRIADEVEEEIFTAHDREVSTTTVGELVTDKLRRVDQVAYVRFASVYKQFKTLDELVNEAKAVIDAKRYEVPGQGRLFIDPNPPATPVNGAVAGANGEHGGDAPRKPRRAKRVEPVPAPVAPAES
ncbi:MAG TPA: transcriptional regulator NrdR [Tepidisphaeraceae bacterium]|nr:transcriptional regulator NrdR [Tepidisphaeraceae bacterium]